MSKDGDVTLAETEGTSEGTEYRLRNMKHRRLRALKRKIIASLAEDRYRYEEIERQGKYEKGCFAVPEQLRGEYEQLQGRMPIRATYLQLVDEELRREAQLISASAAITRANIALATAFASGIVAALALCKGCLGGEPPTPMPSEQPAAIEASPTMPGTPPKVAPKPEPPKTDTMNATNTAEAKPTDGAETKAGETVGDGAGE